MLFHSPIFLLLFALTFILYWGCHNHRWQNYILIIASYIFYASWNWRYLPLLIITTLLDFYVAHQIDRSPDQRTKRRWLIFSIIVNLSILGVFKYFNFFVGSFSKAMVGLGYPIAGLPVLHLILPLGISFYTFQSIGYVVDVYRGHLKPTKRLDDYALFIAFFPHLIAGPINPAKQLIPQVEQPRAVNYERWRRGVILFLWGVYLKMYVGDGLALIIDDGYVQLAKQGLNVWQAWFVTWGFAWQIYADFYGYSLMARGLAYLLGFELIHNFDFPYFAQNYQDFWRRWHISMSNWFRDYLYIPLGGSRGGAFRTYRNLAITMVLAGLWHGPHWTMVFWGFLQAVGLIVHRIWKNFPRKKTSRPVSYLLKLFSIALTLTYLSLTLVFFRAPSFGVALTMLHSLVKPFATFTAFNLTSLIILASHILPVIMLDAWQRLNGYRDAFADMAWYWRAIIAAACLYLILFFGKPGGEFLYFAF